MMDIKLINNFWKLMEFTTIEIPKIQRDYAHGRLDPKTTSVRNTFLNTILNALKSNKKLELDFIYGSIEHRAGGNRVFTPLDGQQRLTTLFLLHWYLAPTEELAAFVSTDEAKFSYETRTSSRLFCNYLIECKQKQILDFTADDVVSRIRDQHWYAYAWNFDPTIQSMLNVIAALHTRLKEAETEQLWNSLISDDGPITFKLLFLEDFALTDDLYIKMNARGKALTPFENFKSYLDEVVDQLDDVGDQWKKSWKENIDGAWTDLFWKYRDVGNKSLIDEAYMSFFTNVLLIYLIGNDKREVINTVNKDEDDDFVIKDFFKQDVEDIYGELLKKLSNKITASDEIPSYIYKKLNLYDRELLEQIAKALNSLIDSSSKKVYLDEYLSGTKRINFDIDNDSFKERNDRERSLFDAFLDKNVTYQERILFWALLQFTMKHQGGKVQDAELFQWMRVVRNLSENTTYDNIEDFGRSIRSINKLIEQPNILQYVADNYDEISGFDTQQREEESIKARLILRKDTDLDMLIYQLEEHEYFLGQIDFILSFCKVDIHNAHTIDISTLKDSMSSYKLRIEALFNGEGLKELPNFIFEKTLLSFGNYLIFVKSRSNSFLINKDRDISWKRFLNTRRTDHGKSARELLKDLLDDELFDYSSVEKSLIAIKENQLATLDKEDWRYGFIKYPIMEDYFNESSEKYIRFQYVGEEIPNDIYILRKQRMSGSHGEYRSLLCYYEWLECKELFEQEDYNVGYEDVSGSEYLPKVSLTKELSTGETLALKVGYSEGSYGITIEIEGVDIQNYYPEIEGYEYHDYNNLLFKEVQGKDCMNEEVERLITQVLHHN